MTPALTQAVGSVVLEWAFLDQAFTAILRSLCRTAADNRQIPWDFKRRIALIKYLAKTLYGNNADEAAALAEFLNRVTDASGKRNDICHGIPGRYEENGYERDVIMVPHPSKSLPVKATTIVVHELLGRLWSKV